jgi:2-methylcitrate dehydratase PrpD
MGFGLHPSVPFLPAVFAVAEETGADGPTTVEAIVQGYEALKIVSAACGQSSYVRGFHCTGTMGAFGAALGVGRLLGLGREQLEQAMGIAGTQAAGLKASFGTMSKHLNAGNAAAVGVLSARLAQAGYTGATDVIESAQGFAAAHNAGPADLDPAHPAASLEDRLGVEQIIFKLHAACGGTHSAINGIRAIKAKRPFGFDELDEIELTVSDQLPHVCGIPEPTTGLEGMFSIRYAASLAVVDSPTGPSAFATERVRDPFLKTVRGRIRVTPVSRIAHTGSPTEVTVRLKNGEVHEACLDALVVTPDEQLGEQWANLEAKFRDLVEPLLGRSRTEELIGMVQRIETLGSIAELTDATAGTH